MRTNTLEKELLANSKKIVRKTQVNEKLTQTILKHLEDLKDNESIPFFQCHLHTKEGESFPNIFVAQWNRNAFGGWFIHVNSDKSDMNRLKNLWVSMATGKGYACSIVSSLKEFKTMLESYRYSCGLSGRQSFSRTFGVRL